MSADNTLPFERGTFQSTPGLEGSVFYDRKRKQRLIVARNTDAAALTGKRLVKWEDREKNQVDYTTGPNDGPLVAGVVDPLLTDAVLTTVPVNSNFYVVAGVCTVAVGSSATVLEVGKFIQPSDDADKGKINSAILSATGAASLEIGFLANKCGVGLASANANANVEVDMQPEIKWW